MTTTATTTETKKEFEPLPEGDYVMAIKTINEVTSKKGDAMIKVAYEIKEGLHAGRLLFDNFLVTCQATPEAVEYATNRVSRLLKSVGVSEGFEGIGNDYSGLSIFVGKNFVGGVDYSKPFRSKENKLLIGNRVKYFRSI